MSSNKKEVPYFRPVLTNSAINEVVECLKSGWLTTGPRVNLFETEFATTVKATHAIALNSCTAALHLAVEAMGLREGQAVLVPTMTFAATAEIIRYQGAVPLLVDCDPTTLNIDLQDAAKKIHELKNGKTNLPASLKVVGIIPVHVGGFMVNMDKIKLFADENDLWIVEDAAHALPASYKAIDGVFRKCGENTAHVTCYSFYANKTMTTGEGGMAVTNNDTVADRIRSMSLHGLSLDAWRRYSGGSWDYQIIAPGYKYNMTDIAAAIGLHQLADLETMRLARQRIAQMYTAELSGLPVQLPKDSADRIHAWHLFPIRLDSNGKTRNKIISKLKDLGVGTSVHWRPLHLHPYYEKSFGWRPNDFPVATTEWERLISLPLFPVMSEKEVKQVCSALAECLQT